MIVGLSSITVNNVNVPLGRADTLFCTGSFPPFSSVSHSGRRASCAQAVPVTLSLTSGLDGGSSSCSPSWQGPLLRRLAEQLPFHWLRPPGLLRQLLSAVNPFPTRCGCGRLEGSG